jgi:predicted phage tail protein
MQVENMTAEDIFTLIDNQSVNKEVGVKLIENYGIKQKQKELVELQEKYGGYTDEIEKALDSMNKKLDEMLKTILGEGKTGEVLS